MKIIDSIKSFIGMSIGISCYILCLITPVLLIYCGTICRTIVILILIYQYFFAGKNETFRRFFKWLKPYNYFNSTNIILEEELNVSNCLFAFHPHGVATMGFAFSSLLNETLNDCILCASRVLMILPLSGLFATWLGLKGVNQKNFINYMKEGIHLFNYLIFL